MSHTSTPSEARSARTLRRLAREASRRAFRQARRDRLNAKHSFLFFA